MLVLHACNRILLLVRDREAVRDADGATDFDSPEISTARRWRLPEGLDSRDDPRSHTPG